MSILSDLVIVFIDNLPKEYVDSLSLVLKGEVQLDQKRIDQVLRNAIPQIEVQQRVKKFVKNWNELPDPPSPKEMATILELTSEGIAHQRRKKNVELTWTGPHGKEINLRRTDQALLELINNAKKRILIVSFAVYRAKIILKALEKAADRGVEISVILESPEVSEGRVAYNTIRALGESLRERSKIYIWPISKRETTADGKTGLLHAKIGMADVNQFYISSANLTDYAMNINMEMGVLIQDSDLAIKIEEHFNELIMSGTLAEIASC